NLVRITPAVDQLIDHFYKNVVGPYWDKERRYIDENYQTIPFPFREIKAPPFKNRFEWTPGHLIGYIGTWSAVKHYEKKNGQDPVNLIREPLLQAWGDDATKPVDFPVLLRVARIIKS
ncbi:MAG: SAM-dependent methyltransferase, partial [Bacteroidetes bacterium]|nr:SAM-dependent methyltransferase [Bacteroidota bacterium]